MAKKSFSYIPALCIHNAHSTHTRIRISFYIKHYILYCRQSIGYYMFNLKKQMFLFFIAIAVIAARSYFYLSIN